MKISTTLLALTLASSVIACGKSSKKSGSNLPAPKKEVASVESAPTAELTEAKADEVVKVEEIKTVPVKLEENVIDVPVVPVVPVVLVDPVVPGENKEVKKDNEEDEENGKGQTPSQEDIVIVDGSCAENADGKGSLAFVQQK
ncbi:MAG: hypothetical protein EOP09_09130, partial [Proteobacteria bacterium]